MTEFLQALQADPLTFVSIALAIISILLAYIFYRRSKRSKEPCWAVRTTTLIEGYSTRLSDLQVLYKGDEVENLSVSRVVLWNTGSDTINASDIADANPLRILATANGVIILDAKLVATNNSSSRPSVDVLPDRKSALLSFDYLDKDQGAVIQVIHTGITSDDLLLDGDIKGAKCLRKRNIRVFRYLPLPTPKELDRRISPSLKRKIRAAMYFAMGLILLVMGVTSYSIQPHATPDLFVLGISLLYYILLTVMALRTWWMHPPSGLEAYEEDMPG
jgi:hypothetical protein